MGGKVLLLVRKTDFSAYESFCSTSGKVCDPRGQICMEVSFEKVLMAGKIQKEATSSLLLV